MSAVSYSVQASSSVSQIWKQIQGKFFDSISYTAEEFSWMEEATDARLDPSTRSVLVPINVYLTGGVASIAEGADEAIPGTAPAQEISLSLCQFNKRFSISVLVQIIDQFAGANATQVESQFKYSGRHMLYAMSNSLADYWWGKSTAVLATTDSDLNDTINSLTLTAGYGETWITDPGFIVRKFQANATAGIGDKVRLYNGTTQVSNGVGVVSASSESAGRIVVTFDGSAPGISTNGLSIVKANSIENSADDYNRGLVGLLDVLLSTSVHGLSSTTVPAWSVAYSDTTGGTFNAKRLRRGTDAITDFGPMKADRIVIDHGTYRNVVGQYSTQLRFSDAFSMPIDGDVKAKGRQILQTKRTPPGFAATWASDCYQRFFGKPDLDSQTKGLSYGDLKKMENKSGLLASANYVGNFVCKSRKAFAYWNNLTTD